MIIMPIPRANTGIIGANMSHMIFPSLVYFSVLPAILAITLLSLKAVIITINGENAIIAHSMPTLIRRTRARAMRGIIIHMAAATFIINSIMTPLVVVLAMASEMEVILEKSRMEI